MPNTNIQSEYGVAAALEAERLSKKYEKDFFGCEELIEILGMGRNNVRSLLNSDSFPTIQIGNRKAVSAIALALWSLKEKNLYN